VSRVTVYWLATGLFCLLFGFGGLAHLFHHQSVASEMAKLGYPPYVMTILGVAKLYGVVALLVPGQPLLKEWAYAGFTFDLLGAIASYLLVGGQASEALRPLGVLLVGAASYLLRPDARRLQPRPALGEGT
jgi:hypothetical protein